MKNSILVLLITAFVSLASGAVADDEHATAVARKGMQCFDSGDFQCSLDNFLKAQDIGQYKGEKKQALDRIVATSAFNLTGENHERREFLSENFRLAEICLRHGNLVDDIDPTLMFYCHFRRAAYAHELGRSSDANYHLRESRYLSENIDSWGLSKADEQEVLNSLRAASQIIGN